MKRITCLSVVLLMTFVSASYAQETIILQPGPDNGIDAKSRKLAPNTNYGDFRDITAHATDMLGPNVSRTFIKFDLSFLSTSVEVLDAKLYLYTADNLPNYPPGQYGDNGSIIQKISEDWGELTLTYNNQPTVDTNGQIFLPPTTHALQHFEDIDVTHFVQEMVQHPDSNFGLRIRLQTEIENRCLCWCSSDYEIDSMRPKLILIVDSCALPVPEFSYQREGDTFNFINSTISVDSLYWDFGDGTFSMLTNPTHVYDTFGVYNVCLTASDSCGDSTTCQLVDYCQYPISNFSHYESRDTFYFTDLSTNANTWYWDFGDGTTDTVQNPIHLYDEFGLYAVCLTAGNDCGNDIFCDTVYNLGDAAFTFLIDNGVCYFYGDTLGIDTWYWDFGDGYYSVEPNPVHAYEEFGTYMVCLTISGVFGEVTECDSVVFCPKPKAAYEYFFSQDTVIFFNLSTEIDSWYWDFGDGFTSTLANPVYVYNENGLYIVCLTVENVCGTDVYCDTLAITGIHNSSKLQEHINIFPNPARDHFIIDFGTKPKDIVSVSVFDITGQLMIHYSIIDDLKIDVSALATGTYIVRINTRWNTHISKFQVLKY